MHIPARFAPLLFGAILSVLMVAIVSAFVLATAQGIGPEFPGKWLRSCLTTWPVAFVSVTVLAPRVRALVGRLTQANG